MKEEEKKDPARWEVNCPVKWPHCREEAEPLILRVGGLVGWGGRRRREEDPFITAGGKKERTKKKKNPSQVPKV